MADRHPAALHMEILAAEVISGLSDESLPADRREVCFAASWRATWTSP